MSLPRSVCRPSDLQIDSTGSIAHGNQNEMEDIDSAKIKPCAEDQIEKTNIDSNELYPVQRETDAKDDAPYCSLSERRKISVMLTASFSGIISPISASIYYPALPSLAKDMHVSISLINLTIMTYLVRSPFRTSFKSFLFQHRSNMFLDTTRNFSLFHRILFGRLWTTDRLYFLFHHIHRGKYWPGVTV